MIGCVFINSFEVNKIKIIKGFDFSTLIKFKGQIDFLKNTMHYTNGDMLLVPTVVQWDSHRELVHGQE